MLIFILPAAFYIRIVKKEPLRSPQKIGVSRAARISIVVQTQSFQGSSVLIQKFYLFAFSITGPDFPHCWNNLYDWEHDSNCAGLDLRLFRFQTSLIWKRIKNVSLLLYQKWLNAIFQMRLWTYRRGHYFQSITRRFQRLYQS